MSGRYTSQRDILKLYAQQNGLCYSCPTKLKIGPKGERLNFICEHKQALARGGDNSFQNKCLHCFDCANEKTHHPRSLATTLCGDNYEAKKTTRLYEKENGLRKAKHPMKLGKRIWPKRKFPKRVT